MSANHFYFLKEGMVNRKASEIQKDLELALSFFLTPGDLKAGHQYCHRLSFLP